MDICVQLTCGQGQHAGRLQREEQQAELQGSFHYEGYELQAVIPQAIPRPPVVVLSPSSFLEPLQ